jgi:hypothetical protein
MKKTILLTLFGILSLTCFSQNGNGGFSQENSSLKIEHLGMINGSNIIQVTNKNTCKEEIRVRWGNYITKKTISENSSDTFLIPQQLHCFVTANVIAPCNSTYRGQVEINYCRLLNLNFEYLKVKQISKEYVQVEFKLLETNNEKQFNIQFSNDGINFNTVHVENVKPFEINRVYNIKIKI